MKKKTVKILRTQQDENQTLGFLTVVDEKETPLFADISLERGWRNNEQNVSCIPTGVYNLKKEWSPSFQQDLWEIYGVPGRSECKFHSANYWDDLNGCIAPGIATSDIDSDGYIDVTSSRKSLGLFHKAMGSDNEAILIVRNNFPEETKNTLDDDC